MSTQLLVGIVYFIVLYGSLSCVAIPVMFFFLWTFFQFWKKHIVMFYVFSIALWAAAVAAFYFSERSWIYWYYPFPDWLQMVGLGVLVFTYVVVKLAQMAITIPVRFFYPLLKEKPIHLKTTGVYKYMRHPMYAVFPLIPLSAFLYTGQLILLPVALFIVATRSWCAEKEEVYLKKVLIGDYEKYKKQTPNRFYPKLF